MEFEKSKYSQKMKIQYNVFKIYYNYFNKN